MRDRRNTSLSVSSNSSSSSTISGSSRSSLNEKRQSSPPPSSPTLPAPVTKENLSTPNARSRLSMALRLFAVTCALVAAWHLFCRPITPFLFNSAPLTDQQESYEPSINALQAPRAIAITDQTGSSRWTVAMPLNQTFPLSRYQQEGICQNGEVFRDSINAEHRLMRAKDWRRKGQYYAFDHSFLEVDHAEQTGVLPVRKADVIGAVCDRSLTFVLDAEDSSFGKSLLHLWLSYGLAKAEGRAFFVDDTRWAYGRYSSFFAPPPSPACFPPPPHQILPCPRSAKHLLVSAATAPWTFGSAFERAFTQGRQRGVERHHQIFNLLRKGYEDLFVLSGEDALYAASRLAKFKEEAHQNSGSVVGIHVRRGDLHPHEYQYSQDYLPIDRFASAARSLLRDQLHSPLPDHHAGINDVHKFVEYVNSPLLLGSDDPEIFDSVEFREAALPFVAQKAQERIQLATKATLDLASPAEPLRDPGSAYVKHIDENSGWEGGFYSSLFYALGTERKSSMPPESRTGDMPSSSVAGGTMQMRTLVGRAYLLDLAVLGESDGVVCAVSSATCRLLGVMMGWDAVSQGRWRNVDDNRSWSWQ